MCGIRQVLVLEMEQCWNHVCENRKHNDKTQACYRHTNANKYTPSRPVCQWDWTPYCILKWAVPHSHITQWESSANFPSWVTGRLARIPLRLAESLVPWTPPTSEFLLQPLGELHSAFIVFLTYNIYMSTLENLSFSFRGFWCDYWSNFTHLKHIYFIHISWTDSGHRCALYIKVLSQ